VTKNQRSILVTCWRKFFCVWMRFLCWESQKVAKLSRHRVLYAYIRNYTLPLWLKLSFYWTFFRVSVFNLLNWAKSNLPWKFQTNAPVTFSAVLLKRNIFIISSNRKESENPIPHSDADPIFPRLSINQSINQSIKTHLYSTIGPYVRARGWAMSGPWEFYPNPS